MLHIISGDESLDTDNPTFANHKPGLTDLLKAIGLDAAYDCAAGESLDYRSSTFADVEFSCVIAFPAESFS